LSAFLPDAKWERMRADARSGEAEFQYADGQNSYLSNLARMPTFVPKCKLQNFMCLFFQ